MKNENSMKKEQEFPAEREQNSPSNQLKGSEAAAHLEIEKLNYELNCHESKYVFSKML